MSRGLLGQRPDPPAPGHVVRYAYVNTSSERGRPQRVEVRVADIESVRVWINGYGNPSYTYRLKDGTMLFMVDDYGAMNDLRGLSPMVVRRKRDLFWPLRKQSAENTEWGWE